MIDTCIKGSSSQSTSPSKGTGPCPLVMNEHLGIPRRDEPMTVGVPFPKGILKNTEQVVIRNQGGGIRPVQIQALQFWSDGSIQWGLIDFFADSKALGTEEYLIEFDETTSQINKGKNPFHIHKEINHWIINNGRGQFQVSTRVFRPFEQVSFDGESFLVQEKGHCRLVMEDLQSYEPLISEIYLECEGPVRLTLFMRGQFSDGKDLGPEFFARTSFFADSGLVDIAFTIRNPKAAHHSGGVWDLGDPGSINFKSLVFSIGLEGSGPSRKFWNTSPCASIHNQESAQVSIVQESSGGKNWKSDNHMNHKNELTPRWNGYRVTQDGQLVEEGKRSTPVMGMIRGNKVLKGCIASFWENFPKLIECDEQELRFGLFPERRAESYELQGGEQKTHNFSIQFSHDADSINELGWMQGRMVAASTPEWYSGTQAISYVVPRSEHDHPQFVKLIDSIVDGNDSFKSRRENIDEFGWRNFGDLYADHENIGNNGSKPRVSHYNNQYDCIHGAAIELFRTGDIRWFEMMRDLAKHVIDIDIYHTCEDRPAYNGGLFWHTDHYVDAGKATHRTYSKVNCPPDSDYGGGPSNEHNYTSGLLQYFFLTGDPLARESVKSLADWVFGMDSGIGGIVGLLDPRPKGAASSTVSSDYHGPGRGAGNSINALIDGYLITQDRKYLHKAEALIRRCIHPHDNIDKRNLPDVEHRWSYTVFLQVLGKYLDFKVSRDEIDGMYGYARESLLHYVRWMNEHEVPYSHVFDRVEYPTETWPAQDMRKSNIFDVAAKYTEGTLRKEFLGKADYFYKTAIEDLVKFSTCRLTRPLVLLLVNGYKHAYFQQMQIPELPIPPHPQKFGQPSSFKGQLHEIKILKVWLEMTVRYLQKVVRKSILR